MPDREVPFSRIPGVRVGHATAPDGATGVTVIRFDPAAPVVVDIRGGVSATYDTGSLSLDATFGRRWAIFFTGGSLYGLDAARGIRTRLLEEGAGHRAFANPNPVLPISGGAIFDLPRALGPIPDYLPLGYEAARVASRQAFESGAIGAGAGATVGKYLGRERAARGGLGAAAARTRSGGYVGVLVVANPVGAIRDPETGTWIAGPRDARGRVLPPRAETVARDAGTHTTLALVVTNLRFSRPELQRIAIEANSGLGRAIVPTSTSYDGDILFAASTERRAPRVGEEVDRIGGLAAELAVSATLRAVGGRRRAPR